MSVPAEPDAAGIAEIACGIPGVAGLHGGQFGEVATYLPGGRLRGVAVRDESVDIHLTVYSGTDVRAVADEVRRRAGDRCDLPVIVTVEDLVEPEEPRVR